MVRDTNDNNIGNVEYIAMGMPSSSIYIPFYFGIKKVPYAYTIGNDKADDKSAFWKFRKLQALVFTDFKHNEPIVRKAFAAQAKKIAIAEVAMAQKYLQSHNPEDIQKFTDETVKNTLSLTDSLIIQLENYYAKTHFDKPKFNNDNLTKLTVDVFNQYKYPGF